LQTRAVGLPVHFMGHVDNRESLAGMLTFADVVLNLGHVETFGLVSVEALATGTPVVVASAGASSEIVNNTCGRVVDLQPELIADAVVELHQLSRSSLSSHCVIRSQEFNWVTTGKKMEQIFSSCIGISQYVNHS